MTVLQFPERRSAGRDQDEPVVCVCGSWWFEMKAPGDELAATFMLAADGRVVGYSAVAHCVACGTQQQP